MKYMETQQVVGVVSAPKDAKMDINWHRLPNIVTDRLVGDAISPLAGWVVVLVWRLTEGVNGRSKAYIPVDRFKRILGTNRDKTAHKYINEAIASGLINCTKENGKTSLYSINQKCPLWYVDEESKPVAENASALVEAENAASGEKRHIPVAENAPATSGEKRHTYKEIIIKENIKENISVTLDDEQQSESEPSEPKSESKKSKIPFEDFWNLYGKKIDTAKSQKKWDSLSEKEQAQAMAHIPSYVKSTPDKKFRKNPLTYLNGKCWLDEIVGEPQQQPKGDPVILDMSKHPQNKPKPEPVFIDMSKHWTERFKNRVGAA